MATALAVITQLFDNRLPYLSHVQRGNIFKSEAQHVHPQREGVAARIALDKSHMLQRLHHPVRRGLRHIHQPVHLREGQLAMLLAKAQQQLQATLQARNQIFDLLLVCHMTSRAIS